MRIKGFTHVELVSTIILAGILSASAWPNLVEWKHQAEYTVFESLNHALLSAANKAHLKQIAAGLGPNEPIKMNGEQIEMINAYPSERAIGLLVDLKGFDYHPQTGWFVWESAGSINCRHDYNPPGWHGAPNSKHPSVKIINSGC